MIKNLEERYSIPVGYSGHEIGWEPSKVAVAMGAKAIERHYTWIKTWWDLITKFLLNQMN